MLFIGKEGLSDFFVLRFVRHARKCILKVFVYVRIHEYFLHHAQHTKHVAHIQQRIAQHFHPENAGYNDFLYVS